MIHVISYDEHAITLRGIRDVLSAEADLQVTGEAVDVGQLEFLLSTVACDVLVVGSSAADLSDLQEPLRLAAAQEHVQVLVYARYHDLRHAIRCLGAGSLGFLPKSSELWSLVEAVRCVAGGQPFVPQELAPALTESSALADELHLALKEQQFVLHYQPQVSRQGHVAGVEALIRWQHPVRGLVQPSGFMQLAEQTGQIVPIGMWALEESCRQLERWSRDPDRSQLQISVNVGAQQVYKEDFADEVRRVLIETRAHPSRLRIELPERLWNEAGSDALAKLNTLAAIGVQFSVDNFGTSSSSLRTLAQLPVSQLKIDRSLVHAIGVNPKAEQVIRTLIAMAAGMEFEVVAEGIETGAQLAFLNTHGCKLSQGFLFGKPMTLQQLESQLTRRASAGR